MTVLLSQLARKGPLAQREEGRLAVLTWARRPAVAMCSQKVPGMAMCA